jgi:hypothetical protein
LRLVHFEKYRGVHVDADQHHSWIIGCSMPRIVSLREPRLPVWRPQLANLFAITAECGYARYRPIRACGPCSRRG